MYDYIIYVNDSKYAEANSHQSLIEYIEQIRVERGERATYTITLKKITSTLGTGLLICFLSSSKCSNFISLL